MLNCKIVSKKIFYGTGEMPLLTRHPTPDGKSEYIDAEEAVEAYRTAIANRDSARCKTEQEIFQQQADAILVEWAACHPNLPLDQLAGSGLRDPEVPRPACDELP